MMRKHVTSFRPCLEALEDRVVPYSLSGSQWANLNVSASFMPDGTITDSGVSSNLIATLNNIAPTATWQREFARALQTWATVTPLNFRFVADNGAAVGTTGSSQGDSRFGDIRLGGYANSNWSGYAYFPGGGTLGGDVFLNTAVSWKVGANPDLFSIFLHETGHALGLEHTSVYPAVMRPSISTVYTGLYADDIAGIQAIYGSRPADSHDGGAGNDSFATATSLSLNTSGAATVNADLTRVSDVDHFRVTAPARFDGTLLVSVDARNLSLLSPQVRVYDANQNLLGSALATTYGSVATVNLTGLVAGQSYYLVADGATTDVFGMGAYQLRAEFGGVTPPPVVSIGNASLAEGHSGTTLATFTLSLSAASSNPVTVTYATADGTATAGSDYTAASGTVTFAPGQDRQTLVVAVAGDSVPESDESFVVNLSQPTNATLGTSQGQATIQNDDIGADRYELNDSFAAATNLGSVSSVSQSNLTFHTTTDSDHFGFTLTRKGTYKVTLTPASGSGTINLTVFTAQQTVVSSNQSSSGSVTLSVSLAAGKLYYMRASSASGSLFAYSLTITKAGGGAGQVVTSVPGDETLLAPGPRDWAALLATASDLGRDRRTDSTRPTSHVTESAPATGQNSALTPRSSAEPLPVRRPLTATSSPRQGGTGRDAFWMRIGRGPNADNSWDTPF